jgi:hypothetical protein
VATSLYTPLHPMACALACVPRAGPSNPTRFYLSSSTPGQLGGGLCYVINLHGCASLPLTWVLWVWLRLTSKHVGLERRRGAAISRARRATRRVQATGTCSCISPPAASSQRRAARPPAAGWGVAGRWAASTPRASEHQASCGRHPRPRCDRRRPLALVRCGEPTLRSHHQKRRHGSVRGGETGNLSSHSHARGRLARWVTAARCWAHSTAAPSTFTMRCGG